MKHFIGFYLLCNLLLFNVNSTNAGEAKVAVAASLTFALKEIADQFQHESGHSLKISYASSGTLTRQIEQGARYELFLSADESYIKRLSNKNLTRDQGQIYAYGQLVIFDAANHLHLASSDLSQLKTALENNSITHFSIPNPELAPYGRIARQALKNAGLWEMLSPFLILGENASQTARFLSTGSVDGALLPLSLAIILHKKGEGTFQLLSTDLYARLSQRMVLLNDAGEVAQAFYDYLQKPAAQKILIKYGFQSAVKY